MNAQVIDRIYVEGSFIILFFISIFTIIKYVNANKRVKKEITLRKKKLSTLDDEIDKAICENKISELISDKHFNTSLIYIFSFLLVVAIVGMGVFAWNGSQNWFPNNTYTLY